MEKLFIDTNIVLDLLAKREGFYREAQELFTLAEERKALLFISSLSFVTTHYILSKHLNANEARKTLLKFKTLVTVLPLDDKILDLALSSDFNDFEDAIQYYIALINKTDIIITRNKKDFRGAELPVLNAREYLNRSNNY